MVLVKALGQLFENRVEGVGRDTLDDQLATGDADRKRLAVANEQGSNAIGDAVDGHIEQRVTAGIYRVLVKGDRQLDQEVS